MCDRCQQEYKQRQGVRKMNDYLLPGTLVPVDHKTFAQLLEERNSYANRVKELEQGKSKEAEDRYWSIFLAIVYSTGEPAERAAQWAADYYREGTRIMREITE